MNLIPLSQTFVRSLDIGGHKLRPYLKLEPSDESDSIRLGFGHGPPAADLREARGIDARVNV